MYKHIMLPTDLLHKDSIGKAVTTACDLAKHYGADLHLVSVSGGIPTSEAHSSAEYGEKLEDFAGTLSKKNGISVTAHNIGAIDPAAEVDGHLLKAVEKTGSDLVVVGSHKPGLAEYVFGSHAGHMASHAKVSVFVVR